MEGARFRHTAQFRAGGPTATPASCTYEQLERPVRFDLGQRARQLSRVPATLVAADVTVVRGPVLGAVRASR